MVCYNKTKFDNILQKKRGEIQMKSEKGMTTIVLLIVIIIVLAGILWLKGISNDKNNIESASTKNTTNTNINNGSNTPSNNSSGTYGLGKNFKQAMDSYEATMDAYIAFMVNYTNSKGTNPQLFKDYAEWLKKYADAVADIKKWENNNLNKEEAKYYIEVQTRVTQKLLNASIDVSYQ